METSTGPKASAHAARSRRSRRASAHIIARLSKAMAVCRLSGRAAKSPMHRSSWTLLRYVGNRCSAIRSEHLNGPKLAESAEKACARVCCEAAYSSVCSNRMHEFMLSSVACFFCSYPCV
eukprot:18569_5